MDTIIRWFLEVTAVGQFWTPALRAAIIFFSLNQIALVLLVLFGHKRQPLQARLMGMWQRVSLLFAPAKPGDVPPQS